MADKLELDSNERDLLDHCIVEMENDTGLTETPRSPKCATNS